MKYIDNEPVPVIELTRRNLTVLLAKLDEPGSHRQLVAARGPRDLCAVRAVEDVEHYSERAPGEMLVNGEII